MERAQKFRCAAEWLWFLAWGVASSVWCVSAAGQLGATVDEPFYLDAGLKCWRTGRGAGWVRRVGVPALWFAATLLSKTSGLVLGPLCLMAVECERLARAGGFRRTGSLAQWGRGVARQLLPAGRDLAVIGACGL